jgi:acyl carrier protein
MSNIRESVIAIIKETCLPTVPDLSDPDKPLLDSGLDSLDFGSALMEIEDVYSVQFSNDDMNELNSLNKIVSYLESKN